MKTRHRPVQEKRGQRQQPLEEATHKARRQDTTTTKKRQDQVKPDKTKLDPTSPDKANKINQTLDKNETKKKQI
jgi:hypothetical protein